MGSEGFHKGVKEGVWNGFSKLEVEKSHQQKKRLELVSLIGEVGRIWIIAIVHQYMED